MNLMDNLAAEKKAAQSILAKGMDNITEKGAGGAEAALRRGEEAAERIDLFKEAGEGLDKLAGTSKTEHRGVEAQTLGDFYVKSLQEKGSRVVLTSSFAPCELRNVDNSLVSRFCSGFLAGIEKPDASTRRRILQEKARQNNALLSDTVVDVLTERLTGDIRQLESCVHNLLLKAKLLGCTISVEMAQEILAQYSLDDPLWMWIPLSARCAKAFGLSPEQLASRSRKQNLVVARNTSFLSRPQAHRVVLAGHRRQIFPPAFHGAQGHRFG